MLFLFLVWFRDVNFVMIVGCCLFVSVIVVLMVFVACSVLLAVTLFDYFAFWVCSLLLWLCFILVCITTL